MDPWAVNLFRELYSVVSITFMYFEFLIHVLIYLYHATEMELTRFKMFNCKLLAFYISSHHFFGCGE